MRFVKAMSSAVCSTSFGPEERRKVSSAGGIAAACSALKSFSAQKRESACSEQMAMHL